MKHTPTPWEVDLVYEDGHLIRADIMHDGRRIGSATVRPDLPAEANARLFRAAPKLLEAEKLALEIIEDPYVDRADIFGRDEIRSAIAKAEVDA